MNASVNKQESHVVAGKPRDAAVNELYGIAILTILAPSDDIFTATIYRGGIVT